MPCIPQCPFGEIADVLEGIIEELNDIGDIDIELDLDAADIEPDELAATGELTSVGPRVFEDGVLGMLVEREVEDDGFTPGWSGPIGPAVEVYKEVGIVAPEECELLLDVVVDRREVLPRVDVERLDDEDEAPGLLEDGTDEQVPNAGWHPGPQY